MLVATAAAFAADASLPGDFGKNLKVSVEGGKYDNEGAVLGKGSYTIPFGQALGLQIDGAVGSIDSKLLAGGGAHLFVRDPTQYLFGVYGGYHSWNDINIWRVAGEVEFYFGRVSLQGLAGYESIGVPEMQNGLFVLNQDQRHFFTNIDLAYYLTEDLKVYAGYRYEARASMGAAGFEYLLRDFGVPFAVFAESRFGETEFTQITGGVRMYFGEDSSKSLMSRHRTEDPRNYTPVFPTLVTATPGTSAPQCKADGGLIAPGNQVSQEACVTVVRSLSAAQCCSKSLSIIRFGTEANPYACSAVCGVAAPS